MLSLSKHFLSILLFLSFGRLRITKRCTFFAITLILFSCAQKVPLTGGKKDVDPPKEIKSSPLNKSIGFISETIVVEFDEFIRLTNLSNQLIVSPLMETPPEIRVKGKKLVIKLKDLLTPNTTYSLNFGNAISDITENNVSPNYKYVFSTGDYIDSLSYSGNVINAFNQFPKENVYVLLYDQFEDSVPLKELPRYIALTDKKGDFSITNIAKGAYKLFAINDINSNYLFDLPNEEIGFSDKLISIDSSTTTNKIYLFEEESNLQYLVKSEHKTYGKIDLIMNSPSKKLSITPLNATFNNEVEKWSNIEFNKSNDSLTIWLLPNALKELEKLVLEIKDGNEVIDTLEFQLIRQTEFKDTTLSLFSNVTSSLNLNQNIFLTLNHPFTKYEKDKIKLYEDSSLVSTTFFTNLGLRKFELGYDFKENTPYQLFIPPNTFEDIYGLKNDTIKFNFKTKKESDYGIINLNVNPSFSGEYIIQVFQNKKLVREDYFIGNQKQQYKYLSPGAYSLKLIIDNNGDKKWNTGNYLDRIQPEKVIFYEKEIKIRANWDNDINWTIKE